MERVLGWDAVRNERKGENSARWKGHLEHVLKARKTVKHHAALSYNDVGEFFTELKQHTNKSALALEFTILTAARSNEVLGAKWDEIELRSVPVTTRDEEGHESTVMGPCWIVPGDRMKGFKRHRIPLSDRAVEILKTVCEEKFLASNSLVFDGLSDLAMWTLLTKQMGRDVTIHGFRSTFRDWAGDIAHYPPEAAEKALAHGIKNKSEAAYWRSDMFDKRRGLMNVWARFCEMPKRSGDVVPIRTLARKAGG
jgi:integrase